MKKISIIKRLTNKITVIGYCLLVIGITTSCNDFLDIKPMNEVVLENYWKQKSDVVSVINSCYESLESEDAMNRMLVWGELRSDNLKEGGNIQNDLREILKESLLPSNPYCNWSVFYQCINRCNTVCRYAPDVQAIDPNYTEDEMNAHIAEATTLRALAYFYLIRTFRDVPYTTEPSIDDTQNYILPATPFEQVLDTLIVDLESVKEAAVRRYYVDESPNAYHNSARITRWAVYALLADLYLWKGNWDKSIECCDKVIKTREWSSEEFKKLGFIFPESKANFVFVTHPKMHANDIYKALRERGILVRHFSLESIDNYLRISIGTDEEMKTLFAALSEILK